MNLAAGIVEIAFGLFLVLGSAQFAVWAQKYNPQFLVRGTPVLAYRVSFLLGGAVFVVFGVLSLFGVIHYKQ